MHKNELLDKIPFSRRMLLKAGGLFALSLFTDNQPIETQTAYCSVKSKIVIVGGGAGGCSIANYLVRKLEHPDITIIEPNPQSVSYQPGHIFIGAGIWDLKDVLADNADFYPSHVKWIKDYVSEFDPDNNLVVTSQKQKIDYDFLIVTTGIQLNYGAIEGLANDKIGENGIVSIYTQEGSVKTQRLIKEFIAKSKNTFQKAVFTHPDTPIKCAGAPKKILFLADDNVRKEGDRKNTELSFFSAPEKLYNITEFESPIKKLFIDKDISYELGHSLVAVEPEKREAYFDFFSMTKGKYDEDLEEYEMITVKKTKKIKYDLLHVVPPMSAPDAVKHSELSWKKGEAMQGGWVEVDFKTLQHKRYENVFSFGDVAGLPLAKTAASVRKQYKVVGQNIISIMEGKELQSEYKGYTACPIITEVGKVIMAEFDWSGNPTPSLPMDPTRERWFWWFVDLYVLKSLCFYGMYKGRI